MTYPWIGEVAQELGMEAATGQNGSAEVISLEGARVWELVREFTTSGDNNSETHDEG